MDNGLKYRVLPVKPERVWRTYRGGKALEAWRGISNPTDGEFPELWVASTMEARNPDTEQDDTAGLSKIKTSDGKELLLKQLIENDPEAFLGPDHVEKYGTNPGILVKIIDSLERLSIQVHPDKKFSRKVFNSEFGKTEAWYIMDVRHTEERKPYILLGFKPGITRSRWVKLFEAQDVEGMLDCLHKVYVNPDEVYLVEGGVPHAIGPGCLLVEIQEPTDYTLRVERRTPSGAVIPDFLCHQGAGFSRMFDCFHYEGLTLSETLRRWQLIPKTIYSDDDYESVLVLGEPYTNLFSMKRISVKRYYKHMQGATFSIVIVLKGEGKVYFGDEYLLVKQGDLFFIPYAVESSKWHAGSSGLLELVVCNP